MSLADAVLAIDRSGLDPLARSVLLAVACGGVDLGDGCRAWVGSLPALAKRSHVGITAIKARLEGLESGGMVSSREVTGRSVRVFDFNAIGRQTTDLGREAADTGRETTGRESGTPRATGAGDSLSEQIMIYEREVERECEGVRGRARAHTHEGEGETGELPILPLDPEAPPSLTPPVAPWAPEPQPALQAAPRRPASYAPPGAAPTGLGAGTVPTQGRAPSAPPASPYSATAGDQSQTWARPEPEPFTPAPSPLPVPGVATMTPAQVDLLRYVVRELEIMLRVTTLVRLWELAAVEVVTKHPEEAVRAGLLSLLDYCDRKPRHRPGPKYLLDRVADAAEGAGQPRPGASARRETPHQRANRDSPFPTDIEVWRGYARAIGQEE